MLTHSTVNQELGWAHMHPLLHWPWRSRNVVFFNGKELLLLSWSLRNRSAVSLRGKTCRVEHMLWDVSRVSSTPGQKQQSWTTQWIVSLPQTGHGHVQGLPADTLHPARGAEGWGAARDLLLVGLAALLASCWSMGRSSQEGLESPLQPNLVLVLPVLHVLQYLPCLGHGRCQADWRSQLMGVSEEIQPAKGTSKMWFSLLHWAERGQICFQGIWSSSSEVCSFQIYLDGF